MRRSSQEPEIAKNRKLSLMIDDKSQKAPSIREEELDD